MLAAIALALCGCASFDVAPARFAGVRQADYFAARELPDTPPAATVYRIKLDPDSTPRVTAGETLSPFLPGEAPGRRPHRRVLRVAFTSPANLSRIGEGLGGVLAIDLYDCKDETPLDFLRLSPVLWRGQRLPAAAATRAIDAAPAPRRYYFFIGTAFDPARAGQREATPVDLARKASDVCFEVEARDRLGDRVRTDPVTAPAAAIRAAIRG